MNKPDSFLFMAIYQSLCIRPGNYLNTTSNKWVSPLCKCIFNCLWKPVLQHFNRYYVTLPEVSTALNPKYKSYLNTFSQTVTYQLYKSPISKAILYHELTSSLPMGFLTLGGLRKVVILGPVSPKASRQPCPFSIPPGGVQNSGDEAKTSGFLKDSNLLPRIWNSSEWGRGARHPGGSGHVPAGLHNAGPFSLRTRGATGAQGAVRSNGSGLAGIGEVLKLIQVARQRTDTGLARPELPRAALPRVLPVTPPGEVERLPSPALSPKETDGDRDPTPR